MDTPAAEVPPLSLAPGRAGARPRRPPSPAARADLALRWAARGWLAVAALGLLIFAVYITRFYGGAALRGDLDAWRQVLPRGHVAGDAWGNGVLDLHLLLAVVVTLGGLLQLLPPLRARAPGLHRWIGRVYLLAVGLVSLGGVYLIATRGTVGDLSQHVAIVLNAAVIWACGVMAWRHAVARRFDAHRRWALRLFLAANGVWFFRVGLMCWLLIFQRPVGFDPQTFSGPLLTALAFGQFLLPLAVLQLYLQVQGGRASVAARWAMAGGLAALTLPMALGIVGASLGMWGPRM